MKENLFIPVILGTNRQGRESEKVANLIHGIAEKKDGLETTLIDVRDYHLPDDDYGEAIKDQFPDYRDAIVQADGLIIVSPEYNHAYPGRLKAFLDIMLREYTHKAVGLVGVSSGPWGGVRVVEALVPTVRELGLVVTSSDLYFPLVGDSFNKDGSPKDERAKERIDGFLTELVWMAQTLKWGRKNLPNKYHES